MINSFLVQNYRQFSQLRLESLKQVNLIVGPNGAGKSSLLEAIWLYACKSRFEVILDLLSYRGEIFRRGVHVEFPDDIRRSPFSTLFCRETYNKVYVANFVAEFDSGDGPEVNELALRLDFSPYTGGSIYFAVHEGDVHQDSKMFDHDAYDFSTRSLHSKRGDNVFLPVAGLDQQAVTDFWERIALTEEEDLVEAALKTFVPNLQRLSLIGGRPVAKLKGAPAPVPLKRLGEGAGRAFALMAAMANARNGVLLIDEIETGLYRTTLQEIWPLIFEAAKKLNVQVFATTHSWDCIAGFAAAAKSTSGEDGALFRLDQKGDDVVAVRYNEETLAVAIEQGIEVR